MCHAIQQCFCIGIHLLQDLARIMEWASHSCLVKIMTVRELFGNLVRMNVR